MIFITFPYIHIVYKGTQMDKEIAKSDRTYIKIADSKIQAQVSMIRQNYR